jgi:ring-1,2-phenylacetyl-CoA epoxidase subunit PaaE
MTSVQDNPQTVPAASRRGVEFHQLTVADVAQLCDDAAAITFDVPPALRGSFDFKAGQSLTIRRYIDGSEQRRSYSICSPVGSAPRIGVREVPGGLFSEWLLREVSRGDVLEVAPPSGAFTPDLAAGGTHVLIVAGSGITPALSIAASLLQNPATGVTLLYGNRRTDSVMFADELADLKDSYPERLQLVHVLSREPQEAELFTGRLDADKLATLLPLLTEVDGVDHWWLCGPYGLVVDSHRVLSDLAVPPARVHQELFYVDDVPPEPVRHLEPGIEGDTSEVVLVLDGRTTTTTMSREVSILDGAQRVRPDLPFACKGGVCGTCRAKLVEGDVDMRRNFALDESELATGFVLTCQSVPMSAEVTVDFDA